MAKKGYKELLLDPEIRSRIREQLAGYRRMNEIVQAERRLRLSRMTAEESTAIFDSLIRTWELARIQDRSMSGFEARRMRDIIEYRRVFNLIGERLSARNESSV